MAFLLLCVVCQIPISLSVLYTGANISTISISSTQTMATYILQTLSKREPQKSGRRLLFFVVVGGFFSLKNRMLHSATHYVGHLFLVFDRDLRGQIGYTVRAH